MREIKFRARHAGIPACWVYGYYYVTADGQSRIVDNKYDYLVIAGTQEQYTGLKDRNDKEIYENDIVKHENTGDICIIRWHTEFASFCINKNGWGYSHFFQEAFTHNECEVIGNLFENPELLNQKG